MPDKFDYLVEISEMLVRITVYPVRECVDEQQAINTVIEYGDDVHSFTPIERKELINKRTVKVIGTASEPEYFVEEPRTKYFHPPTDSGR